MSDRPDLGGATSGPPEFPEIEQQLLGNIFVKPALFEHVADLVGPDHFCEEAYGRIWGVLQEMWRRGVPLGLTSCLEPIVDDLGWPRKDTGGLLARLMAGAVMPVRDQTVRHAELVRDVWLRRQVWQIGTDMVNRTRGGLDNSGAKIIEETEAQLYDVATAGVVEQERSFTFSQSVAAGLEQAQLAADQRAAGHLVGVPTGLGVVDRKLGGLRDTDLIVVGARPGQGKTALALRIVEAAARRFAEAQPERPDWVMMFSMEMSHDQLALRQVTAGARVSFERVRLGNADAQDLMALETAGQAIRDLPIRIDDTARISVSAMRTRCRRWARRHGRVGLVVVDYLQLVGLSREEMRDTGGNRVQEVSTITRALKALAKDLAVPVLCLAQLNRDVEKREDKRPMLSDLRESGCLAGETMIYCPDTGKMRRIDSMVGERPQVAAIDQTGLGNLVVGANTRKVFFSGTKPVFMVRTGSGRSIRATANHKFLTLSGWVALGDLAVGQQVAVPNFLPGPSAHDLSDAQCALLGHLIGDGCVLPKHATQYTTKDEDLAQIVAMSAIEAFGEKISPRVKWEGNKKTGASWMQVYLPARGLGHHSRNPIHEWFGALGIGGLRSYEKRIPLIVFTQAPRVIAKFLHHLWATDGCISILPRPTRGKNILKRRAPSDLLHINYTSTSAVLSVGVHDLLLRLGIKSSVRAVDQGSKGRPRYDVVVIGLLSKRRFVQKVGVAGRRKSFLVERAKGLLASRGVGIAADGHIYWDSIVSVTPDGIESVYDIEVPKLHNFIANGIVVHNSIEQDADLVAFLYREAYYLAARRPAKKERESVFDHETRVVEWRNSCETLKDTAELIIAKNRHGSLGTLELKFRPEWMLFEDDTPGGAGSQEERARQMALDIENRIT